MLQADSLLSEPPGKPMNTGVVRLSLIQGDLPNPGIELGSLALLADSLPGKLLSQYTRYNSCVYMCAQPLSHIQLFATLWAIAHQAPLSMEFHRQEYWSGLPISSSRGIFLTQ